MALSAKKLIEFGKECLNLGSDLNEVQNVVDVTFGSMAGTVNDFAKNAMTSFGLSEKVAKDYMGTTGAMAKAFGYSTSEAEKMAESLTGLSADVASFYNLSTDDAYSKLKSVFTGETESLKSLGVVMSQTALDAFALAKGYGKTTAQMTEQEKVGLRLAFVQDKLSAASGDFARTSDGWANQTKVLKLRFDAMKASLGQGLINILTPAVKLLNELMALLQGAAEQFKDWTEEVFGDAGAGTSTATAASKALEENMTGAAKSAQEYKNSLAGLDEIDEINVLNSTSESGTAAPEASTDGSGSVSKTVQETNKSAEKSVSIIGKIKSALQSSGISVYIENLKKDLHDWFAGTVERFKSMAPVFDSVKTWLKDFWSNHLCPLFTKIHEYVQSFMAYFQASWNALAPAVIPVVKEIGNAINTLVDVFGFVLDAAGGLMDFITGDFTGDWEAAWNGIVKFVEGLWNGLTTILKKPINAMIDALNYLVGKMNSISFDVPDWVPGIGGKHVGISIPEIPALANGGYVAANTPQLALIGDNRHEGEIVAPESKITEAVSTALGGVLDRLAAIVARNNPESRAESQTQLINITVGEEKLDSILLASERRRALRSGGI